MPIYELACEDGHRSEPSRRRRPAAGLPGLRRGDAQGPSGSGSPGRPPCPRPPSACPDLEGHLPGRPRRRHPPAPHGRCPPRPGGRVGSPPRAGDRHRPPRSARRGRGADHGAGHGLRRRGGPGRRFRAAAGRVLDRRLAVPGAARAGRLPARPDQVVAVVATCLELGVPPTARGAGTLDRPATPSAPATIMAWPGTWGGCWRSTRRRPRRRSSGWCSTTSRRRPGPTAALRARPVDPQPLHPRD